MIPTKLIEGVLTELRDRGVRIVYDGDDKMHLAGKGAKEVEKDEKVMAALKAFRPHILAKIKAAFEGAGEDPNPTTAPARPEWETCRECQSLVSCKMTAEDAMILCNRAGARGSVSTAGFKVQQPTNPCPYHPPRR